MPILSTAKMTSQQFLKLGEDPEGVRLELVNGEVAVSPSPTPQHSFTEKMLSFVLQQHILQNDLGELYGDVDTLFGPYDVRRPDIIFFSKRRLDLVGRAAMEGPPDLCVEIVSPSSGEIDRVDKFSQYAAGGVAFYWIVDPIRKTMEGFRLVDKAFVPTAGGKDADVLRLPPFDDLDISLKRLWREPTSPNS